METDQRQTGPAAWREETAAWAEAYSGDEEIRRRRAAIPAKLQLLGLGQADRKARILDLCCGNGEALDALYEMGFRDLHGADISIFPQLAGDSRFQVQVTDAAQLPFEDETFDWVLIIHAMHHLGMAPRIQEVANQCYRILRPGGRLAVLDFPNSPQIRVAFWWFRQDLFLWTNYLKRFSKLIHEEWPFLKDYLPQFAQVKRILLDGPFEIESKINKFFYFYWRLRKPLRAKLETSIR